MNSETRSTNSLQPTQDEIALRAHQIWLESGCPHGHDIDNWINAESQLREEYAALNTNASAATGSKRRTRGERTEDINLAPASEDVPYSAFDADAPLATKVAEQLIDPSGPESRRSKTSLEVDTP